MNTHKRVLYILEYVKACNIFPWSHWFKIIIMHSMLFNVLFLAGGQGHWFSWSFHCSFRNQKREKKVFWRIEPMCFWYRSQARRSWHLYQSSFDCGKMFFTHQGKAERNYHKKLLSHGRLATKFLLSGPWDAESLSFRATGDRYGRAVRLQIVNSSTRRVKQERVLLSLRKVKEMPWRQWPRCGLGWLCILLVICCSVTVVSSYCVALSYGHIYPFLPAISETGVLFPEKYVFRELANLSAFLFISNAFVRFMQYKLVAEQYPEDNVKLHRLNKLAFVVAILAGLGMTLVANFEIEKVCSKLKFAVSLLCKETNQSKWNHERYAEGVGERLHFRVLNTLWRQCSRVFVRLEITNDVTLQSI